jgi:hypothetical protein
VLPSLSTTVRYSSVVEPTWRTSGFAQGAGAKQGADQALEGLLVPRDHPFRVGNVALLEGVTMVARNPGA